MPLPLTRPGSSYATSALYRVAAIWVVSTLAMAGPASTLDTLQVESSDPFLDPWNWRVFDRADPLTGWIAHVYEDRDTAIWFAISGGVVRYDGVQWTRYSYEDGLVHGNVRRVLQATDGAMWFGTRKGISRLQDGRWTSWGPDEGLAGHNVTDLLEAQDGSLWAVFQAFDDSTTPGTGVSRFDGEGWRVVELPASPEPWDVGHIVEGADGSIWISAWDRGVLRHDGAAWTLYAREDLGEDHAWALAWTGDGSVWVTGQGVGISRFDGARWTTHTPADSLTWSTLWTDPDGTLWAGGKGSVAHFDGRRWRVYSPDEIMPVALPGKAAPRGLGGLVTRDGSVWLGVASAAARFSADGMAPTRHRHPDRLFGGYEDPAGGVWFHTDHMAVLHLDGQWIGHTADDGFLDGEVYGAWQAAGGDVWFVGTHEGQTAVARRRGNEWSVFTTADGLIDRLYVDPDTDDGDSFSYRYWEGHFAETADGQVWIGGAHGGQAAVCRLEGDRWQRHLLPGGRVTQSFAASDGSVWFGTWDGEASVDGGGLHHYDGERWHRYDDADGLPSSRVYGISEYPEGTVWVGVLNGVGRRPLDAAANVPWQTVEGVGGDLRSHKFGGFVPTAGSLFFKGFGSGGGSVVYRHDGEVLYPYSQHGLSYVTDMQAAADSGVWVSGPEGLALFRDGDWSRFAAADGVEFARNAGPTSGAEGQVPWDAIHAVADGGLWVSSADGTLTHLSASTRDIVPETRLLPAAEQVSSAGLIQLQWSGGDRWKYSKSWEIRYQWQLDDGEWSALSTSTDVTHASLSPGQHHFQVRAVNRHGNVDPTPAEHRFVVEAPWYRNLWVQAGASGSTALIIVLVVRLAQRNRELHRLNAQLHQVSQYKSDFLARMSHDLRTPMNAIIGYTRILLRRTHDDLDPRMYGNLESIRTSADHLLGLINDILDLSRVEAGRVELAPKDTDVRHLVGNCVTAVAPLVQDGVELRQELADLPPARLDPERLRRVVMNLLGNAVKFTEAGSITVSLRAVGSHLELSVADTGVGIAPDELPHIFEEFRQVGGAGNAQEGTGLGLSIARKSVELMGGTIEAHSEVGRGTTFTIHLPATG